MDEVSETLTKELQERVTLAGVKIDEARLSHLAYAPEIAHAMLQRQQAEAVVAARTRIVDGAVGMVEMALERLDKHSTVKLDDERRAAMVSNLLVVLCGDKSAQPVVNTGTLYSRRTVTIMSGRKSFLVRLPEELLVELNRWARDDLRSLNGQIEYLLREAVRQRRGVVMPPEGPQPPDTTKPA